MQNWKYKLASFMYGRYGTDALYYGLLAGWFLFQLLFSMTGHWEFFVLSWVTLIYMTYRVFSRNIIRRRRENEVFLKWWHPVKDFCKLQFHRIRDVRTSVYRKCPHCKAVLKLPRRRGKHTANCPRCSHRFPVWVWF